MMCTEPGWLDVRRAVLGTLLDAERPMPVPEIVEVLSAVIGSAVTNQRVSDILRYQARIGHVRRVRRGVYVAVPESFSYSTGWRCRHWERQWQRRTAAPRAQ